MPACDQVSRQAAIERLRRTLRVAPDFTDAIAELMIIVWVAREFADPDRLKKI
jgi:hypothetical protein